MPIVLPVLVVAAAIAGYFLWTSKSTSPPTGVALPPSGATGPGSSAPAPGSGLKPLGMAPAKPAPPPLHLAPLKEQPPAPSPTGNTEIAVLATRLSQTTTPSSTMGALAEVLHEIIVQGLKALAASPTLTNLDDTISRLSAPSMGPEGAAAAAQLSTLRSNVNPRDQVSGVAQAAVAQAGAFLHRS